MEGHSAQNPCRGGILSEIGMFRQLRLSRLRRGSFILPGLGLTACCRQSRSTAYADSNSSRQNEHKTREKYPAYIDSSEQIHEQDPSHGANGLRRSSSQGTQMPGQICCKQNTQRAEHLVAENNLGVRKAGVTPREMYRVNRTCHMPEHQKSIRIACGPYEEQNTCNSIQPTCFHRNFSERRIGRSRDQRAHKEIAGWRPRPLGRRRTCRKTPC